MTIRPQEIYVPETQVGARYHIWRLVTSPPFENFIMLLIILNTILLMCKVGLAFVLIPYLCFEHHPCIQKAEKKLMIFKKYISFCWSMEKSSYTMNIHDKVKLCDSFCESSSIWRNGNQVILLGYSPHFPYYAFLTQCKPLLRISITTQKLP